ncbi:unnamed protein product [Arctia plantaginis]|uniref:Uncharacterized protein n=1 Tax=Arctia plantaginis TaxID=874455 RepID=A0A8S0Z5G6_ARCPL|nr:unnamed protein product [Arctia plantaginis]
MYRAPVVPLLIDSAAGVASLGYICVIRETADLCNVLDPVRLSAVTQKHASIAHVVALRVGVFSLIACGAVGRMRGGASARTLFGCHTTAHSAGKPTSRYTRAHRSLREATPAPCGQEPSLALPSP